jgi:hypothetical protein
MATRYAVVKLYPWTMLLVTDLKSGRTTGVSPPDPDLPAYMLPAFETREDAETFADGAQIIELEDA